MKIDALCIGNASYDLTFILDSYPEENKKYVAKELIESAGGPASNEAYLLAKWGLKTEFIGLIGDDYFGKEILKDFRKTKVGTKFLEIRKEYHTPVSCISVNKNNGSRTIINRRSFTDKININLKKFKKLKPKVILLDGNEIDVSILALNLFKDAITILDAGSLRKETEELAKRVDYLVCSEDFAKSYTSVKNLQDENSFSLCINKLKLLTNKTIVVTMGEKGLIYYDGNSIKQLKAYKVHAVDTTGSGDVFHGAFAYFILKGHSLLDSLKFASKAAAISVTKKGSRTSIPTLDEVYQLEL